MSRLARIASAGAGALLALSAVADPEECRRLEPTDPAGADACFRELLFDPAAANRAEAAWALGDVAAANRAFRVAVREADDDAAIRVRWGDLFLAIDQAADAEGLYREALARDAGFAAAKLGLARLALGRFDTRAETLANDVLKADPTNAHARLLLARMALEVGDLERARQELVVPLTATELPVRLDAMALAAAMDHIAGTAPSAWEDRALELHPRYGALHETIAHFYIITRRYREAIAQLERAVALDPKLWSAHATLGANLLRVNRFAEARRSLARAHDGHPYNAEVVNTLRLLDSLETWDVLDEEGLVLRTDPAETEALAPYVQRLVADGVRVIGERYGYVSSEPVVVELYPHHEDFAVRTSGLPGIGILGATFGNVVVMDSPAARSVDDGFDWASALWHEVAHVVTLGATRNRVSRWFSEGISVMEEWQTGPSRYQAAPDVDAEHAGRRAVPVSVIDAYRDGRLLPVASLDEGFIRPRYEGQVGVSYTQAGLVCEYIGFAHGQQALARMLVAYGRGEDTADVIRTALGVDPAALDEAFAAYLEDRFDGIDPAAFAVAVAQARGSATAGNWVAAADAARRAIGSHPGSVAQPSAYPILAQAEEQLGRREAAIAALLAYWRAGGRTTEPLAQLAAWLEEDGRRGEALAVRRDLALVAPLDGDHRVRLADLLMATGNTRQALAEYQVHLSLGPRDVAHAHYRLAQAYHGLGDIDIARRHVLQALEIAPRYRAALDLLLEISQ